MMAFATSAASAPGDGIGVGGRNGFGTRPIVTSEPVNRDVAPPPRNDVPGSIATRSKS